jgi:hypothetical protein
LLLKRVGLFVGLVLLLWLLLEVLVCLVDALEGRVLTVGAQVLARPILMWGRRFRGRVREIGRDGGRVAGSLGRLLQDTGPWLRVRVQKQVLDATVAAVVL